MSKSMAVAIVALFFSLTGWGVAAKVALAPANTVNTNSVVNGSIRLVDLAPATVRMLKGQKGDTGAPGPQGLQGPVGPPDTSLAFRLSTLEGRVSTAERRISSICPSLYTKIIRDVTTSYLTGQITVSYDFCPV